MATSLGPAAFNVYANYAFFDESSGSGEFTDREELTIGFTSKVTPDVKIGASTLRDLESDESLRHDIFLEYECDCFTMRVDFTRTFTQDRDIQPSDSIFIRLIFKTLGSVETAT